MRAGTDGVDGEASDRDRAIGDRRMDLMIHIACPWCEQDAPIDADLLLDSGGRFTCAACLTTVELVDDPAEVPWSLAA